VAHIFISYVHENQEEVQRLCDDLTKHGVKVWLDRNEIKIGTFWKDAIREAIREGDFFIACFSEKYHSRDKTFMNDELGVAIEELRQYRYTRAWFLPVLLEECEVPTIGISGTETLIDIREIGEPAVPTLIEALGDEDRRVRGGVARALGGIGEPAVPALIKALGDEDEIVRLRALRALGGIGKPAKDAVPVLIKALGDEDENVRLCAVRALRGIGTPEALKAIEAYKQQEWINREVRLSGEYV